MEFKKTEMVSVPIPTEIPAPPRLENLPPEILHSATVEMLIQQNEDLSSRLKVNIRRNSSLEQKILELQGQITEIERTKENLTAQNEIILEKEHLWSLQKEEKSRQLQSLEKEISLLQLRYNEMFTTHQHNQKEMQKMISEKSQIIESLKLKLIHSQKIKTRAKDKLRVFLLDMGCEFNALKAESEKSQAKNRQLAQSFEKLFEDLQTKEQIFRNELEDFKTNAQEKIQKLEDQLECSELKNQSLSENLEIAQEEIHSFKLKLNEEKKNRNQLSILNQELSELKNEKIRLKRDHLSVIELLENARQSEFDKILSLKSDLEQTQAQLLENQDQLSQCEQKILELNKDNQEMSTQLSALQKLWMDTQAELEKEVLKRQSLEKINRELSQSYQNDKILRATQRAIQDFENTSLDSSSSDQKVFISQPPSIDI